MAGLVHEQAGQPDSLGPLLGDYVEGRDATFAAAVEPKDAVYRIVLTLGDPETDRGPFSLVVNDQVMPGDVVTRAGKPVQVSFEVQPTDGRLSFRLTGRDCNSWSLAAADIYGPTGARPTRLFPEPADGSSVPPPDSLRYLGRVEPLEVLRSYCEFLMAWRPGDGGFSHDGAWYQNAYPIRTLFSGGVSQQVPEWCEAAETCLDFFVSQQRPDGNWYSGYSGTSVCTSTSWQDTVSANLADIGTMSLTLALAVPLVSGDRQEAYLRAATRYADQIVLPAQLADGAFPNGLYENKEHLQAYTIATATQAASLAALGALTGDARYSRAADRAGLWLARRIHLDGTIDFHSHDHPSAHSLKATRFGNSFYIVEALTWVERYTADPEIREEMRVAVDRFLWGQKGIQADAEMGYWWNPNDLWSDSKMGGMLYILVRASKWHGNPILRNWIQQALAWLADPDLSRRIGVLAPPPSRTGVFAMTATGFSGIGMAELVSQEP